MKIMDVIRHYRGWRRCGCGRRASWRAAWNWVYRHREPARARVRTIIKGGGCGE